MVGGRMTSLDLADVLAAEPAPVRPRCKFGRILDASTNRTRELLEQRLDEWPLLEVARILTDAGHPISYESVRIHKIGYCRCGRTTEGATR